MARKRWTSGAFIRICLEDGTYAYGRLREFPNAVFYDFRSDKPVSDFLEISSKPVLFSISVHKSVLGRWEVIGKAPLEESMKQLPEEFMQDLADFTKCEIFDSQGIGRDARPEECIGLERVAVWEDGAVEERLLDQFMGRPNKHVESMKVRLK